MVCRMPKASGTSKSVTVAAWPPMFTVLITKSAPASAAAPVGLGPHGRGLLASVVADGDLAELLGESEPRAVDVVHHQVELAEVVEGEQVAQELTGELRGAGAHEDDGGHRASMSAACEMSKVDHHELIECGHFRVADGRLST